MVTEEIVTSDLAQFGWREKKIAAELLLAADKGLPNDFDGEGVTVAMNKNSGYVFLTNSEFQVAMLEDGKVVSFYSCPECGEEGTWNDSIKDHGRTGGAACRQWVRDLEEAR